ncbi:hypothetical protein [Sphingomonas aerolata]|uniref:hypothetical protein n=1 Tax=Sphingomonas aerolata TaxID=185951 RepID=UPI002FE3C7B7
MAGLFKPLFEQFGVSPVQPLQPVMIEPVSLGDTPSVFDQFGQAPQQAAQAPQPMMQPQAAPQPRQASVPVQQAAQEANPFDQFDEPVAPPEGVQQVAQPITGPNAVETTEAQRIASETFNRDISELVNSGASREQIEARVAQEQARGNAASLNGLEEALAYRDKYHSAVPVGIANDAGLAKPEDYHGPDRGAVNAAGVGAFDSITMGAGDEIGGAIGATTNAVARAFGGGTGEGWTDAYGRIRDENRQALNDAQHYHPGAYLGGQVVGGIATLPLGGGEAALAQGGWRAAGRLAGEGAVLGGAYGFNSGTGDLTDRLEEGGKGAALGAIGGAVLGTPSMRSRVG